MDDLTAFVNARLDEDEAAAREAHYEGQHDPARVLREVAAKRRLLDYAFANAAVIDGEWGGGSTEDEIRAGKCHGVGADAAMDVLTLLALPYSDHPDYRLEWAQDVPTSPSSSGTPRSPHPWPSSPT
jgi:hypothetical protein